MGTSLQWNNKNKIKVCCLLTSMNPPWPGSLFQKYFWDVFTTIQNSGCLDKALVAPQAFEASCQQLIFQFFCLILHTKEVVFLKEAASVNLFVLSYVFALLAISFASCAPRLPLNIFSASCRSYSDTTHTHKVNLRTSQFAKLLSWPRETLWLIFISEIGTWRPDVRTSR